MRALKHGGERERTQLICDQPFLLDQGGAFQHHDQQAQQAERELERAAAAEHPDEVG